MTCKGCGCEVPDGAKFCPQCGSRVEEAKNRKKVCPECAAEYDSDVVYCVKCGRKLVEKTEKAGKVGDSQAAGEKESKSLYSVLDGDEEIVLQDKEAEIMEEEMKILSLTGLTYYRGEPKASIRGELGKLTIWKNHLSFVSFMSSQPGKGFLVAGRKLEIPMQQIAVVREGRYLGVWKTLVLDLKNGETHSFAAAVPGASASIRGAILAVRQQMEKC